MSLITNLAAGIQKTPLSHAEVIEAGREGGVADQRAARHDRRGAVAVSLIDDARAWRDQDPDDTTRAELD